MASSGAAAAGAFSRVERAHQMYRDGRYEDALGFYTDALAVAKTKPQKIALHSNRAACFLKLHDFKKAAEECTSVLELDHEHTGALMLRAQTLVTLKEYHSALFDVNRLIELNPSSEVYKNLEARLRTQLSLAPIPELEEELEEDEGDDELGMERDIEPCNRAGVDEDVSSEGRLSSLTPPSISAEQKQLLGQGPNQRTGAVRIAAAKASSTTSSEKEDAKGWQAIPKPKGHSTLDYARWDRVDDNSSEDENEDDDDESMPQYRFRVRTVGVRPVK